jgi:hypothetical protein
MPAEQFGLKVSEKRNTLISAGIRSPKSPSQYPSYLTDLTVSAASVGHSVHQGLFRTTAVRFQADGVTLILITGSKSCGYVPHGANLLDYEVK